MRKTLSGFATGLLLALGSHAQAAEVGSGTLTLTETSIAFSNDLIVGTNATNAAGVQCIDPVLPCDQFALTVDLPEDLSTYFPTALIHVVLDDAGSLTGADDYDLAFYDADGNIIGESGNLPGEPETASTVGLGGINTYTVEVIHWLVLGAGYTLDIDLDLGIPSDDVSDEELAAWIDQNTGGEGLFANSRALETCTMPGATLLEDAGGDVDPLALGLANVPVDTLDLQELSVFQVGSIEDPNDPPLIAFRLHVASLEMGFLPNSAYYTSFKVGGATYGVRLSVDEQGSVSYFSYVPSGNNDGGVDGRFVTAGSERPASSQSYYDDSEIVIFVRPQDIGLYEPGQMLEGFNAATTLSVGVPGVGGLISGTMDEMPDGLGRSGEFTYLSDEECAVDADEGSTESRRLPATVRGGATGGLLLVMLGLFGFTRRR